MTMNSNFLIPTCHVAGHSLARRGGEWIDAATFKMPEAPRVRIRFESREFFDLLRRFPSLAMLSSLGRSFQLVLGGTVYEIFD